MRTLACGLFLCCQAWGQTFDAATIRVSQSAPVKGEGSERDSIVFNPVALTMSNVSLKSCLRWAYSLNEYEIAAPLWMSDVKWDIRARSDETLTRDKARQMLQNLLTSRFHMKLHRDVTEIPVYELVVNKPSSRLAHSIAVGEPQMLPTENGELSYSHYSMERFASSLTTIPFRLDRTVVDQTGLNGVFDFRLKIADNAAEMKNGLERGDGPSASEVLGQLGLKLRPRKDAVSVLAIDYSDRMPSDN